jgi:hypothetical protein
MANKYTKTPSPKKTILETHYFIGMKTQAEIGVMYNVSQKVVFRWFRDLGIQSRIPIKRNQFGENNSSWKGNKAKYATLHKRVQVQRGIADHCEECGRSDDGISYDWANQTENYADVNDYKMMCRSCHFKKDNHRNNLPNRIAPKNINKKKLLDGK